MKTSLLVGLALLGSVVAAHAAPQQDKCDGKLHNSPDGIGLVLGGGKGEDESICWISQKADAKWVLAICAIGEWCEVGGLINLCKEAPECVEVTHITSVATHPTK